MRVASSILLVMVSIVCVSQNKPLTNQQIVDMLGGGLSADTVVMAIQTQPSNFDVSPSALLKLKQAGVPDKVMQAMLATSAQKKDNAESGDVRSLLDRVQKSMGGVDRLKSVTSLVLQGSYTQQSSSGHFEGTLKRGVILPNRSATEITPSSGQLSRIVITPEETFVSTGANLAPLSSSVREDWQHSLDLDPLNILARGNDPKVKFALAGSDNVNGAAVKRLKVGLNGREADWYVDANGKIVRAVISGLDATGRSIQTTTDFADYRSVAGILVPFSRHSVSSTGLTSDLTISTYEINATPDAGMFTKPSAPAYSPVQSTSGGLQIRVLQTERVPYSVQYGGNSISSSCSMNGSVDTTSSSTTVGNMTYGSATSYPNLHMSCNTYQNPPAQWRHVLNVMLVVGSNNTGYIIACDAAWRWSKCRGLVAGDTFAADMASNGLQVEYYVNGKPQRATYRILQERVLSK